jgi:hypothetical protein
MIYLSDLVPVLELRVGVLRLAADSVSRTYEPRQALSASRRGLEPEASRRDDLSQRLSSGSGAPGGRPAAGRRQGLAHLRAASGTERARAWRHAPKAAAPKAAPESRAPRRAPRGVRPEQWVAGRALRGVASHAPRGVRRAQWVVGRALRGVASHASRAMRREPCAASHAPRAMRREPCAASHAPRATRRAPRSGSRAVRCGAHLHVGQGARAENCHSCSW